VKSEYLFPGIAIIAKSWPRPEYPQKNACGAKQEKLSDPAWMEG